MKMLTMHHTAKLHGLLIALLGLAFVTPVNAGKLRSSVSLDYSDGEYGNDEKTDIWSTTLSTRYKTGKWTLKASLPFISINGPGNVIGLEGSPGKGSKKTEKNSGIGDLYLSASYLAHYDYENGLGFSIKTKIKFPLADESRLLGTGKTDVGIEIDPFWVIDKNTLFGSLGYKVYGDPDDTPTQNFSEYNNVWFGSFGVMHQFSKGNTIGLMARYRQALTNTSDSRRTGMLFATKKMGDKRKLQFYVLAGGGNSSPDWGSGLMLQQQF